MAAINTDNGICHEVLFEGMPVFGNLALSIDANRGETTPRSVEERALIEETVARVAGELITPSALTDSDN